MPDLIDVATGEPFVLEGRVVTMGPRGVIDDGAVYIRGGAIEAVDARGAPTPPGFVGARRVKSGGTIYPGLIELHNHLPYNAVPLWLVPRIYTNNGGWRGTHEYQRNVSKPAQVLGKSGDLIGPLIRFVECRALLGGVTTSQGVTLYGTGVSSTKFAGLIRNVERPRVTGVQAVGTRVDNPPTKQGEKLDYLERQKGADCYLAHQSEGVDDTARGWFRRLRLDDGTWAIHDSFTGIHCTALKAEDFDVLAQHNAHMVWSPLSNYLLYGETTDVEAMRQSGILVGLGSDWGPSGSKNLLEELKVARLASDQHPAGGFTNEDLVRMVTSDAARILRWEKAVGSIEPQKRADLVVLNGRSGDPFDELVEARETTVTLVMIDGVPRVGQHRLMSHTFKLDPGVEAVSYGGSDRELYLHQEDAHELVQGVTLGGATATLDDALSHLPERAQALDNAIVASLDRHPVLASARVGGDLLDRELAAEADLGFLAADGNRYTVELELDPQPLRLLAGSLGDFVFPMRLEPITVVSDGDHFAKLVAARNLPDFVSDGLPGMYGESVPAPFEPEGARVLDGRFPAHVNASFRSLRGFLAERRSLDVEERLRIVKQAQILLGENYVHLPLKRSMHGIDPLQRLRLLRHQLTRMEASADVGDLPPDIEFHRELTQIFNSLRDLHTTYRLPDPFRGMVAWLPFLVEEFWERTPGTGGTEQRRFIVSKLLGGDEAQPEDPALRSLKGKEIIYWNGIPIETAVARNGERCAGSNPAARHARGLNSLTIRPLGTGLPPDEDLVRITYRDGNRERVFECEWSVFMPEPGLHSVDLSQPSTAGITVASMGLDAHTDDIQEAKKILFAPTVWLEERVGGGDRIRNIRRGQSGLDTSLPTVFRARKVETERGPLGYLRIFTFNVSSEREFVDEMGRLLAGLPRKGLIIDLRGNGGGLIPAAEGALQLLTARRIEAQRAQFINTPRNLELCLKHPDEDPEDGQGRPSARLRQWARSINESVQTGAVYSRGFPITSTEFLESIERKYVGPVALVTDALCYSAADMFAAGFQDHEIGPVIGVHDNTGAGGANVWSLALLRALWDVDEPEESPYEDPGGNADFRVAMRRTVRVGLNSGSVVEDLGIIPTDVHHMTRNDLERDNEDLIEAVADHLAK